MSAGPLAPSRRRLVPADFAFLIFLAVQAGLSVLLLPYDFTDLCYLFSLEQGRWVPQEWVHPIYVPTLAVWRAILARFGYHGQMLVPVELLNVGLASLAFLLLYRLARRLSGSPAAAAIAVASTTLCTGFWLAAVRPTPYAPALLCLLLSLSVLITERPPSAARFALAGVFAALAMGFHASAMALGLTGVLFAILDRDRRFPWKNILAFSLAMLLTAIGCWAIFLFYHGIGADYFRRHEFGAVFAGIEQVPGSSIYTSGSVGRQIEEFRNTIAYQAPVPARFVLALAVVLPILLWQGHRFTPIHRRLALAAGLNLLTISGFFLINNTHNGFNFAAYALIPALAAVVFGRSQLLLVLLLVLAVPNLRANVMAMVGSGFGGANNPLLAETRFLQETMGTRDILLVPGSPFPEVLYLSPLVLFELADGSTDRSMGDVPVLEITPALRARIGWWLGNGRRVFLAMGDETTDFTGDVNGAEKEKQIFWRPELEARERAPRLQAVRDALGAQGIEIHGGIQSPRGQQYGIVQLNEAPTAAPPSVAPIAEPAELLALLLPDSAEAAGRARYLGQLQQALPGDPWMACDVMDLVCDSSPRRGRDPLPCRLLDGCNNDKAVSRNAQGPQACRGAGCSTRPAEPASACFWGPVAERPPIDAWLKAWAERQGLTPPVQWDLKLDARRALLSFEVGEGKLQFQWELLDGCASGPVETTADRFAAGRLPSPAAIEELARDLPVARVRPGQ